MRKVEIKSGEVVIRAHLLNTTTASRIWSVLPIHGVAQTWGDEVYFEAHVESGREADAKTVIEPGELAFWPEGDAIVLGYGPTPISRGSEVRLAAPCNIWAIAEDDVRQLHVVKAGELVEIVRLQQKPDAG